jgi:hypothetical protein
MRITNRGETPRPRPQAGADVLRESEPAPDDDFYFDPERDISIESKKEMFKELERYWVKSWNNFTDLAGSILMLFPEYCGELNSRDTLRNEMKEILEKWRNNPENFRTLAANLLVLFPERRDEFDLGDTEFNGIKAELELWRGKNWWDFSYIAMRLLILFPDRWNELRLGRTEMNAIKDLVESYRGKDWWTFSKIAYNLYILSSQRAEIDATGKLVVTPRTPKIMAEPAPLPKMYVA